METVSLVGFYILCFLVVVGIALQCAVLRRLRVHHPEVWRQLGEPTLVYNNSIKTGAAIMRFMRERRDLPLGDKGLSLLVRITNHYGRALLVLFVAFVVFLCLRGRLTP